MQEAAHRCAGLSSTARQNTFPVACRTLRRLTLRSSREAGARVGAIPSVTKPRDEIWLSSRAPRRERSPRPGHVLSAHGWLASNCTLPHPLLAGSTSPPRAASYARPSARLEPTLGPPPRSRGLEQGYWGCIAVRLQPLRPIPPSSSPSSPAPPPRRVLDCAPTHLAHSLNLPVWSPCPATAIS